MQFYSWVEIFVSNLIKFDEVKQFKVKFNKILIIVLINVFGYKDLKVELVMDLNGELVLDIDLIDYENVFYLEDIDDYFVCEVFFYVLDVWLDESFIDVRDG